MWDSQEEIERDIKQHATNVLLGSFKRNYGWRRFFKLEYWSILLFGV